MNILVVCNYGLYSDLTYSFVHAQTAAYVALGHKVRVVVPLAVAKRDRNGKRLSAGMAKHSIDGVEIYDIRYLSLSKYGKRHFNASSAKAALAGKLSQILEGFTPDIIHAHTLGFESELGAWLKKKLNCPLVVTTHGSDTHDPYRYGQIGDLKRWCDKADYVVAVSSALAEKLRRCGSKTPVRVILNGFRIDNLPQAREHVPFSMLQVSSLIPRKKADVSIRTLAKLKESYPGMRMAIVGEGGEKARLLALCEELHISDSVDFLGQIPNEQVMEEMARAQFFVMPSVREGFGIVYLEAMACGCIAVGIEGEGIGDLIVNGKNGFLVPADAPDAIVDVISWCFENPEEAHCIAEQGRKDAMCLNWENNATQYISLFKGMVNE